MPTNAQVRKEYAAKLKRLETQQAIQRSTMINQTRLKRVHQCLRFCNLPKALTNGECMGMH